MDTQIRGLWCRRHIDNEHHDHNDIIIIKFVYR